MMRLIVTLFLSAFFLLVRGNNHQYAATQHSLACFSSAQLSEKTEAGGTDTGKHNQTVTGKTASSSAEDDGMNATELEDEDDVTSSRKFVEITNYFLSFFYPQVCGAVSLYQKDRLPVCKHFSCFSAYKHIKQCVIRV